jgi:hypothetical protein
MDKVLELLDEVIGYAHANAVAARTKDENMTWAAHHRNCIEVKRLIEESQKSAPAS